MKRQDLFANQVIFPIGKMGGRIYVTKRVWFSKSARYHAGRESKFFAEIRIYKSEREEAGSMRHFFAYLSRMRLIRRWGLMRNTYEENVQEHSLQVALVAHGLALIRNRYFAGTVNADRVMTLAAFHEAGEVFTGDLATPIKYFNPEIKRAYDVIEDFAKGRIVGMLPVELQEEYHPLLFPLETERELWKIVKAADKICAYLKCIEELKSGNQEFSQAERSIRADIEKMDAPEVAYFMTHFTPSFGLALDELN